MAKMGYGYGSECHLLRYLGRHRDLLDARVRKVVGAWEVHWLDFEFDPAKEWPDVEWAGLDFLPTESLARTAWQGFWPQRGTPPNWDAVGQVTIDGRLEWLLVEAKAHLEELQSSCTAMEEGGRPTILAAMEATKRALGVPTDRDWLTGYYQYCNRLAILHFLNGHDVPARLLLIYFFGDKVPGRECPKDQEEWTNAIRAQAAHVGLPEYHPLIDRIHTLFLPVAS